MIWILITTCLLTLSIVPPAYLQYASFAPLLSITQKNGCVPDTLSVSWQKHWS